MSGKEAIQLAGKAMCKDFSIDTPELAEPYRLVYENFVANLKGETNKGILLVGGIGVGKTMCMRIMQRLFRETPAMFVHRKSKDAKDLLEVMNLGEIKEHFGCGSPYDFYIEDIGANTAEVKKYGNSTNIVSEVVFDRYDAFVGSGIRTHFCTNLFPDSVNDVPTIRKIYGDRVYDRLLEMTNMIVFKGKSLR